MSTKTLGTWENRSTLGGAGNTIRGLTHSLDLTKEGLAMKATRVCAQCGTGPLGRDQDHFCSPECYHASTRTDYDAPEYAATTWKRMLAKRHITETGCWQWTAALQRNGYGRISWKGAPRFSHRVAFEIARGPIPDGLVIDHLCRNRACFNPDHLEPVTHQENLLRGVGPGGRFTALICEETP